VSEDRRPDEATGAVGAVRRLEAAIDASSAARSAAEERLNSARSEASRLLTAAAEDAAAAAEKRRRSVLAAADAEAAAIHREAEARVVELRADTGANREAAVEAALALVLPAGEESEA
jgi:vacuolar-type H+-ATPase subunit H